jgi:hypothetical protein
MLRARCLIGAVAAKAVLAGSVLLVAKRLDRVQAHVAARSREYAFSINPKQK